MENLLIQNHKAFCHLLKTFASSLDPDSVSPDLDPNSLTLKVLLKESFEKVNFEKSQQTTAKIF